MAFSQYLNITGLELDLIGTVRKKNISENISPNCIKITLKEEPLDCLDFTLGKDTLQIFHTNIGAKHLAKSSKNKFITIKM